MGDDDDDSSETHILSYSMCAPVEALAIAPPTQARAMNDDGTAIGSSDDELPVSQLFECRRIRIHYVEPEGCSRTYGWA